MLDPLFEESPVIQRLQQKYLEQGKIAALRRVLVNVTHARYPDLAEQAQQQASHFDNSDALELLIQQVVTAPDVNAVRWLLESDFRKVGTGNSTRKHI